MLHFVLWKHQLVWSQHINKEEGQETLCYKHTVNFIHIKCYLISSWSFLLFTMDPFFSVMTLWRELHWIWLPLFSDDQRNHYLSGDHLWWVQLRVLYFKLGERVLQKALAALPCLLCDLLLYLPNNANIARGDPLWRLQEKRHCLSGENIKLRNWENDLLSWLLHQGVCLFLTEGERTLSRTLLSFWVFVWPLGGAIVSQWNRSFLREVLKSHQIYFPPKFPAHPALNTQNFRETT